MVSLAPTSLVPLPHPRPAPRSPQARGVLASWFAALDQHRRAALREKLVRTDLALVTSAPTLFEPGHRVARVALMLLTHAAADLNLGPGELAMLMDDAETQTLHTLAELLELCAHA
ncbi:MAG: hypothetical protein SFZ24_08980 [Planctomycetota bacterium]|nr:hypothetical protein [Planctomycetota bacterium]